MNDRSTAISSRAALLEMINGYRLSQLIFAAAQLNIADLLQDGPKHYSELAEGSGVDPIALYRLLRALASAGVFTELEGERFELNPLSELLCDDASTSLRAFAVHSGRQMYPVWNHLLTTIRTGQTAYQQLYGMSAWEYRQQNPEERQVFDAAMSDLISYTAAAVADAYDFSKFRSIVDVGGGQGALLGSILAANPNLHGTLFDQAQVISGGPAALEAAGLLARCELVGGSFLESVPSGADVYTLSHIVHDWDDPEATKILRACRRAMSAGQILLLIERVIDPAKPRLQETLSDVNMMLALGGCERTRAEYERLLSAAGFQANRLIPTRAPDSILEATAV